MLRNGSRRSATRMHSERRKDEAQVLRRERGALGANILEVDHRRLFLDVPAKGAKLDVTIETRDAAHAEEVMAAFAADGYLPVRIEAGPAIE